MTVAIGIGWWIGWAVALVVVLLAAGLLLTVIALGRRVAGQADDITAALDGARENTAPLFDVTRTNLAVDRITRGLRGVRTGDPEPLEIAEQPSQPPGPTTGPVEALKRKWQERGE